MSSQIHSLYLRRFYLGYGALVASQRGMSDSGTNGTSVNGNNARLAQISAQGTRRLVFILCTCSRNFSLGDGALDVPQNGLSDSDAASISTNEDDGNRNNAQLAPHSRTLPPSSNDNLELDPEEEDLRVYPDPDANGTFVNREDGNTNSMQLARNDRGLPPSNKEPSSEKSQEDSPPPYSEYPDMEIPETDSREDLRAFLAVY